MNTLRKYINIVEGPQVKFPITPAIVNQAKQGGKVYWGQAVSDAEAKQCFAMINKTVGAMLPAEGCKFALEDMDLDGNTLMIVPDENSPKYPQDDDRGMVQEVLDCSYDTEITADGKVYHTIGINAGYRGHTSPGFVTALLGQIYKGMEFLHGPGQRTMAINDDKGAGVWQNIMSKLGAKQEA